MALFFGVCFFLYFLKLSAGKKSIIVLFRLSDVLHIS